MFYMFHYIILWTFPLTVLNGTFATKKEGSGRGGAAVLMSVICSHRPWSTVCPRSASGMVT